MKRYLFIAVLMLFAFSTVAFAFNSSKLKLLSCVWVVQANSVVCIEGIVFNGYDKACSATIDFDLYNYSGVLIGQASDSVNNLQSGGKWRFSAWVSSPEVGEKFKLSKLAAYPPR